MGSRRARGLRGLILILLRIELEIEEACQVAARPCPAAASASTAAKGNLDLPEGRFGPQQILQRLLLARHRVLPLPDFQLAGRGIHRLGRRIHIRDKAIELLIRLGEFAALHAIGERPRLGSQLGLNLGEKLCRFGGLRWRRVLLSLLLPGRGDDLLFALRDVVLVALTAAAAPAPAAGCLRLREVSLEGIGLDEEDVGAGIGAGVFRRCIQAYHVARNQFEIFERKHGGTVGLFHALLLEQIGRLFGAAVDRIMQVESAQAVIVLGVSGDGHLFNRAGPVVARRPRDGHLRRLRHGRRDEVIARKANRLSVVERGDVVDPILIIGMVPL